MKLHKYQIRGVDFGLKTKSVYQMVDMGLGKTAMCLTLGSMLPYPMFVFAPLNVCYGVWPEEIKKWTPNMSYTILHGKYKDSNLRLDRKVYLLNYDGIKWFFRACCNRKFKLRKFFVVFDESSNFKDPSTKRFGYLQKMMPMYSKYIVNLSGTPSPNGLHNLWSQYYMLDGGKRLGGVYGHFKTKLFIEEGPPKFKVFPKRGTKNYIYSRVQDITFRLKKEDHLELPPVVYNSIPLQLTYKQQKEYDKIEKRGIFESYEHGITMDLENQGSEMAKAHQYTQGAVYTYESHREFVQVHDHKAQALKQVLDQLGGNPLLCAIWHRFDHVLISKVLGYDPPLISGGTPPELTQRYLKQWNQGQLPLLLVHPVSTKFGLNLQAGGHNLMWYSMTWSLDAYQQLNSRLIRQGQQNRVIIHHLVMQNTMDEVIFRALGAKGASQDDLLEAMKAYMRLKYNIR